MASEPLATIILAVGVTTAALVDLRTRRVPNALTFSLAAIGLCCAAAGLSGVTVQSAVIALLLGGTVMLPGYIFGATGAGDVKLMASAATLLGASHVINAFLYTAIAGGALALVIALYRSRLRDTLHRACRVLGLPLYESDGGQPTNNQFAYAPAIALGTLLTALGR